MKILLVEDQPLNVELFRDLLTDDGIDVRQVDTAEEALVLARSDRPDLILMDVSLPGMDGLEATRILKASPETAGIFIVVLTARAMKGDEEEARAAGCDAYLTKPINTRTFAATLHSFLGAGQIGDR
ncbi:MAG TPA: response regulator [Thermoanaerobaculia bacterium]|nr:response regulator [Thermoanaerobaculia bacterium]